MIDPWSKRKRDLPWRWLWWTLLPHIGFGADSPTRRERLAAWLWVRLP